MMRIILTLLVLSAVLVHVPIAVAKTSSVVEDWQADGRIDGTYSVDQLDATRQQMAANELEYSTLDRELTKARTQALAAEARRGRSSDAGAKPAIYAVGLAVIALAGAAGAFWWRRRQGDSEG